MQEEEELDPQMSLGGGLGLGLLLLLIIIIIIIVIVCCCRKKEKRGCFNCYLCSRRQKDDSSTHGKYKSDPKRDVFIIQIENPDEETKKDTKNAMILNPKYKLKRYRDYLV